MPVNLPQRDHPATHPVRRGGFNANTTDMVHPACARSIPACSEESLRQVGLTMYPHHEGMHLTRSCRSDNQKEPEQAWNECTPVQDSIRAIAIRHCVSEGAVRRLVQGLLLTDGAQVEFNEPELGGPGQWMPGLIKVRDASNSALKRRIDAICSEIAQQIQSGTLRPTNTPPHQNRPITWEENGLVWWPGEMGSPTLTGALHGIRYAWFAHVRRLLIDEEGHVRVYDSGMHRISGILLKHAAGQRALVFTSQHGTLDLTVLPAICEKPPTV